MKEKIIGNNYTDKEVIKCIEHSVIIVNFSSKAR